jgi:hypothetical protein
MPTPNDNDRVSRTREDWLVLLWDQLEYIRASAASYDAGHEGEAKRLAVVLRVLLHDTRTSKSLLGSLGIKETLRFWQVMGTAPLEAMVFMGLSMTFTPKGVRYVPTLRDPKERLTIEEWWNALVLYNPKENVRFSRGNGILELADTDGGAHVDPKLNAAYAALSRDNSFGWEVHRGNGERGIVENSPVLPLVRTAAHEVYGALMEQLPNLLADWVHGPKQ